MKLICLWTAAATLLAGCGKNSSQPPASTNRSSAASEPISGPADYLGALGKAHQSALKTVDTARLNQAVQLFNVERGRNPTDLNELVKENYLPQIPPAPYGMKIVYEAESGEVKVVKQAPQ